MTTPDASDSPPKAVVDALNTLLGVEGPLRLLPQGSSIRPHIVIKRTYADGEGGSSETSSKVARFSFVAGKKIKVNKGEPLLFAVACPTDREGKTLLCDDNVFLLEGDLIGEVDKPREEKPYRPLLLREAPTSLPPKVRKSLTGKGSYSSYIEGEASIRLGLPGYPPGFPSTRTFATAGAQTDPSPPTPSINGLTTTPRLPFSKNLTNDNSPIQLPSPVSADHAREPRSEPPAPDGDEGAEFPHAERSLSPMDLSSMDGTPLRTPDSLHRQLPQEKIDLPVALSVLPIFTNEDAMECEPSMPLGNSSNSAPIEESVPQPLEKAKSLPHSQIIADSDPKVSLDVANAPASKEDNGAQEEPDKEVKRELIMAADKSTSEDVLLIGSKSLPQVHQAHAAKPDKIPWAPRAIMARISTVDSKEVPYIPTPTSSNPLGIRPSSSAILPKAVPKGPRSLVGAPANTSTAPALSKKPVVVGANWTPVRNNAGTSSTSGSGPSSSSNHATLNAASGSLSASSSSSSLSSLTTLPPSSPVVPTLTPSSASKPSLSHILGYNSPSPPPPPESDPPPPLPPQTPPPLVNKWKKISCTNDKPTQAADPASATAKQANKAGPGDKAKNATATTDLSTKNVFAQAAGSSLKRIHSAADSEREKGKSAAEPKNKKPRIETSELSSSSAAPLSSTSSVTSSSKGSKNQPAPSSPSKTPTIGQKIPHPFTHPLPPKPVAGGSSYRPQQKRDRSPEPEAKRSVRTDWPATPSIFEHHIQSHATGLEPSVQKIIFNSKGTQIAVICADHTLRIWDNHGPGASEVESLPHHSALCSACWVEGDAELMTLSMDGKVTDWKLHGNEWRSSKLLVASGVSAGETPLCMSYTGSRIAVAFPSCVKFWKLVNKSWQLHHEVKRAGVTIVKFLQDGDTLAGGCNDGVLWFYEVPSDKVRFHTLGFEKPIISIDLHPTGAYVLVGQDGGRAHLVNMSGAVERTYTSEKLRSLSQKGFPGIFATNGQAVLFGTVNGCALVWDRKKETIVYGLKHVDDDPIQTAAIFDGRSAMVGSMITGTKQGRLFWWPPPVAAASTHNADDSRKRTRNVASS